MRQVISKNKTQTHKSLTPSRIADSNAGQITDLKAALPTGPPEVTENLPFRKIPRGPLDANLHGTGL